MANAVTQLANVPVGHNSGLGIWTVPLLPVFDTLDSDFTIYTPAADTYWAITGMQLREASAHTLTFKSGTTTLLAMENTTFTKESFTLGQGIFLMSQAKGEVLALRMSTALVTSLIIYVQEFKEIIF